MKNLFFIHVLACISLSLITHDVFCQDFNDSENLTIRSSETAVPYHSSAFPVNTIKDYRNAISVKAVRLFIKNFKYAENVTWTKSSLGNYSAEFHIDSIQTMVEYNTRGSWKSTLKRYAENRLTKSVKAIIKSNYPNYTIKKIAEINEWQKREDITYSILLRNRAEIRLVIICNRQIKVAAAFTDQNISAN